MTIYAFSHQLPADSYKALRHLFHEAVKSSMSDGLWLIYSTSTDPGVEIMTEYIHKCGDRIRCQSYEYMDGAYMKHIFTFTPDESAQ